MHGQAKEPMFSGLGGPGLRMSKQNTSTKAQLPCLGYDREL